MRKNKIGKENRDFSILALDDDSIMTVTLKAYFESVGYSVDVQNDPIAAIEQVRENNYDILLLDFLMNPICGDEVVSRIRAFNRDIYIILLTGHRSLAPPVKTIRELDIQGYYEKSDRFDQLELLVESCVKSIQQMRTIQKYQSGLTNILCRIPDIYVLEPKHPVFDSMLEGATLLLNCQDAFLYLNERSTEEYLETHLPVKKKGPLFVGAGKYKNNTSFGEAEFKNVQEIAKSLGETTFTKDGRLYLLFSAGKETSVGVICMDVKTPLDYHALQLSRLYEKQVTGAVTNLALFSQLKQKTNALNETYAELKDNYLEVVMALRSMVDARDIYTRGHSDRVAYFACRIAEAMDKTPAYIENLRIASLFHDIGKVGTPDAILFKDFSLDEVEYSQIRQHCIQGERILSKLSRYCEIASIVRGHHERYDGKGYPDQLSGKDVLEESRIICIADAFDAMTSQRRYRTSLNLEQSKEELKLGSGTQFDPEIVEIFLSVLEDYKKIEEDIAWTFLSPDEVERIYPMKEGY